MNLISTDFLIYKSLQMFSSSNSYLGVGLKPIILLFLFPILLIVYILKYTLIFGQTQIEKSHFPDTC
jgi:hypothetical protein